MAHVKENEGELAPPTLRKLFSIHLPNQSAKGMLNVSDLATALECSTANVQRMLRLNRVFKRHVDALCALKGSTLTPEIIGPYLFDGDNYVPTLQEVLADNLPNHLSTINKGSVSAMKLSHALSVSRETIYRMLRANELRAGYVNKLIDLPGSKLTVEKLTPFVDFG